MILILLATGIPLIIVVERFAKSYAERQAGDALSQIGWQMRDALDRGMAQRLAQVQATAKRGALQNFSDPAAMQRVVENLASTSPYFAWVGVTGLDGQVVAANQGLLKGANVTERPWFRNALNGIYVGDLHPAVLLEKLLPATDEPWRFVDLAVPIHGPDGSLRGVLAAHLSWAWARDIQKGLIEPRQQRLQTDVWIVQANGNVLLGPDGHVVQSTLHLDAIERARRGERGYLIETWPDGRRYITSYSTTLGMDDYKGLGWIVLARQTEELAFAEFKQLRAQLAATAVIVGVGLLLLAIALARRIARPLSTLAEAVERYALGDPAARIPAAGDFRESALLAQTISRLVESERQHAQTLEARVEERAIALHEANEQLTKVLSEVARAEESARESEALMRDILENANNAYLSINSAGLVTAWNREAERLFGWTREEALAQPMAEMIIPEHLREAHRRGMAHFLKTGEGPILNKRIEIPALRRDGSEFPAELTVCVVKQRGEHVISGFLHDISERKQSERKLEEQAMQDALTGLPNRRALLERLPGAMARAKRWNKPLALMFLDLDGFKGVNDTHGHDTGDELLKHFALRLASNVRQTDTVARLAGDEFTILLEALTGGPADAEAIANKILASMAASFELPKAEIRSSASIGITIFQPGSELSVDDLLANADRAMYAAKRAGKNRYSMLEATS